MKHIHMFIEFYFNELFLLFVLKIGLYFRIGYLSDLFSNLRRGSLRDKKKHFHVSFWWTLISKKKKLFFSQNK